MHPIHFQPPLKPCNTAYPKKSHLPLPTPTAHEACIRFVRPWLVVVASHVSLRLNLKLIQWACRGSRKSTIDRELLEPSEC